MMVPTLVFALIFSCLLRLGYWQLDRAEGKQVLLKQQDFRRKQQPIQLAGNNDTVGNLRYRQVILKGIYDVEHQFLIDNRVVNGKVGFFVLTPLHIQSSQHSVLVNRGWAPLGRDRNDLPQLHMDSREVTVEGIIDHFPGVGFKLDGAGTPSQGWPAIVQVVDDSILSEVLGYPLLPFQVLLDRDARQGYYRHWVFKSSMPPRKHRAYAFQWFALATMLAILFFLYSTSTSNPKTPKKSGGLNDR